MSHCCLYHAEPAIMQSKHVQLPTHMTFKAKSGARLNAVLYNRNGRIKFAGERMKNSWTEACKYAAIKCGERLDTKHMAESLWYINIDGQDVRVCDVKHYIHNSNAILDDDSQIFCAEVAKEVFAVVEKKTKKPVAKPEKTEGKRKAAPSKAKASKCAKDDWMLIEDTDEEEEAELTWTPKDEGNWKNEVVDEYIRRNPALAPKLLRITQSFFPTCHPKGTINPFFECIFEHPTTKEEMTVDLSGTTLYNTPSYQAAYVAFVNKTKESLLI